jgi:hypothetical protein
VFDRSLITRWRQRMGEEKCSALLQESLNVAVRTNAAKPTDFAKVIIDTTVQPKAVAFPTDARLMHRALARLVQLAKKHGVQLRQSYVRVGRFALPKCSTETQDVMMSRRVMMNPAKRTTLAYRLSNRSALKIPPLMAPILTS